MPYHRGLEYYEKVNIFELYIIRVLGRRISIMFWTRYRIQAWPMKVNESILAKSITYKIRLKVSYTINGALELYVYNKDIKEFDKLIQGIWSWYRTKEEFLYGHSDNIDDSLFLKGTTLMRIDSVYGAINIFD